MYHRAVIGTKSGLLLCRCRRRYYSSVYDEMLHVLMSKNDGKSIPQKKKGISSWNDSYQVEKLLCQMKHPAKNKVDSAVDTEYRRGEWKSIESRINGYSSQQIIDTKQAFYEIEGTLLPNATSMKGVEKPVSTLRGIVREFISAGLDDDGEFMKRVIKWASNHNKNIQGEGQRNIAPWDSFYVSVVGSLLSLGKIEFALECHELIYPYPHLRPHRWWLVIQASMVHSNGLNGLKSIIKKLPNGDSELYSQIIPALTMKNKWSEAIEWHWFLTHIQSRFFPKVTSEMDIILKAISKDYPLPILLRDISRIRARYLLNEINLTESTLEILLNHLFSKKSQQPRDNNLLLYNQVEEICKWVIKGKNKDELGMKFWKIVLNQRHLNINQIHYLMDKYGSQNIKGYKNDPLYLEAIIFRQSISSSRKSIMAVLERISKCKGKPILSIDACGHIAKLCAFGIDIEFAINLYKVVSSRDDDGKVARDLMVGLAMGKEYKQVYKFHSEILVKNNKATRETWNILLRTQVDNGEFSLSMKTVEEMIILNIPIESKSSIKLAQFILRPRRKFKRAILKNSTIGQIDQDDLQLSIKMLIHCLKYSHGRVQPEAWREVLIRTIQTCGFNAISILSMYLANTYSTTTTIVKHQLRHKGISTRAHSHPLRRLFNNGYIKHIIKQGFDRVPRQPWIGLILLNSLAKNYGVYLSKSILLNEINQRLNILFNLNYKNLSRRHLMIRQRNMYTYNQLKFIFNCILKYNSSIIFTPRQKQQIRLDNNNNRNIIYISPGKLPDYQFKSRKKLLKLKRSKNSHLISHLV